MEGGRYGKDVGEGGVGQRGKGRLVLSQREGGNERYVGHVMRVLSGEKKDEV